MGLLDESCCRLRRLVVVGKLYVVINLIELFIDRQVQVDQIIHLLIFRFEIQGLDPPILTDTVLDKIASCDSTEAGVLIFQLLKVRVFSSVYDLVLEGFIYCAHIFIDSTSFVMLEL